MKRYIPMSCLILCACGLASAQDGAWRQPGEIKQPSGSWQVPGQIQKPRDEWQKPGEIQKPGDFQKVESADCETRFRASSDALFAFDSAELGAQAEASLARLLEALGSQKVESLRVEGHTDSKGAEAYNLELSGKRAAAVMSWLESRSFQRPSTIQGFGESRPVAPNQNAEGEDNPEGRALNRRVEVVAVGCEK